MLVTPVGVFGLTTLVDRLVGTAFGEGDAFLARVNGFQSTIVEGHAAHATPPSAITSFRTASAFLLSKLHVDAITAIEANASGSLTAAVERPCVVDR
jgi:hypothetical protein